MKNKDWVFLKDVFSLNEYDIVANILAEENIPVMRKIPGSGGTLEVIMGTGIKTQIKIYVPAQKLEHAREILSSMEHGDNYDFDSDNTYSYSKDMYGDNRYGDMVENNDNSDSPDFLDKRNRFLKIIFFIVLIAYLGPYLIRLLQF